jgi:ADP-dependent NAD(P)H-hydrate dehydratase
MRASRSVPHPLVITPRLLAQWPLPAAEEGGDKDGRGRVLAIGGGTEMPGAILLAGIAALRAGAGKLQIATCTSVAPHVGVMVPEARVIGLPTTRSGGIAPTAAAKCIALAKGVDAMVVGPGMVDHRAVHAFTRRLVERVTDPTIVLDAAAVTIARKLVPRTKAKVVLTPHAGEAASMMGITKAEVTRDPASMARRIAKELGVVVALKGAITFVADPSGTSYENRAGNVGLATSGSGDTLSGIVAGLAARGASPMQAAVWAVHLHAKAGERLAKRIGPIGYLARELLAEIPPLLAQLDRSKT